MRINSQPYASHTVLRPFCHPTCKVDGRVGRPPTSGGTVLARGQARHSINKRCPTAHQHKGWRHAQHLVPATLPTAAHKQHKCCGPCQATASHCALPCDSTSTSATVGPLPPTSNVSSVTVTIPQMARAAYTAEGRVALRQHVQVRVCSFDASVCETGDGTSFKTCSSCTEATSSEARGCPPSTLAT